MSRKFVRWGALPGVPLAGVALALTGLLYACSRSPLDIDSASLSAGQRATDGPDTDRDGPDARDRDPVVDEVSAPPPEPDAVDNPDVVPPPCLPGTGDFIYLITDTLALHRFNPRSGQSQAIGPLDCANPVESAFSMAVDRAGNAVVLLRDGGFAAPGQLVRASTRNGQCERIAEYEPGQLGFGLFGMAFTGDPDRDGETLYVHGGELTGSGAGLGALDTESWVVSPVGVEAEVGAAELAGTPEGRLLALFTRSQAWDSWSLAELDRETGRLVWEQPLPSLPAGVDAFAVAFWDDKLYAFLSQPRPSGGSETTVLRYALDDQDLEDVAVLPLRIVGAGATTCEPNPLSGDG